MLLWGQTSFHREHKQASNFALQLSEISTLLEIVYSAYLPCFCQFKSPAHYHKPFFQIVRLFYDTFESFYDCWKSFCDFSQLKAFAIEG